MSTQKTHSFLFSFENLSSKDKSLKTLEKAFLRAGAEIAQIDADNKARRTAGISYKTVSLVFADSQNVELLIKNTGDIYKVKINKKDTPIKSQDNHKKAVEEIAKILEKGRSAFQERLTKIKQELPKDLKSRSGVKTKKQKLETQKEELQTLLAELKEEFKRLQAECPEQI